MRERNRRRESNRARYYVPNGKCEQFINLVGSNECFINMLIAANGLGKSAAGANIVTNICYGPQNEWFDKPLFRKFPYLKKGRIISDPTTIKEKIIPELKKWFPANEAKRIPEANYESTKDGKFYESHFKTSTGFEFDIMSNEQELKEFESVDLGWVWADEPMQKDKFVATIARGRLGMVFFWTFTPLNYSAWIKDWRDEKMLENKAGDLFLDFIEGELEDNCKVHGVRGILEHRHIVRMVKSYNPDEVEARVFGKFGHLIGRVHKRFRRGVHVIRPFPLNERDYTIYHALDPHPRNPDHAMWVAVDKKGTKYVCGELITKGPTPILAERIKAFEAARNFRVEKRIIDPSAFNENQHEPTPTLASKLGELGLHYIGGSKDLQAGIKRTDDALDYEESSGDMVRPPELYFFDTCPVTIKQFEEYVWGEYKGPQKDEKKPKGQPRDRNDHQPENLHRILLSEPVFVPKVMSNGTDMEEEERELDPYAP